MTGSRAHRIVLVVLLTAGSVFLAAPTPIKPEKIKGGPVKWQSDNQSFEIQFSATATLAERAVREGWVMSTTLTLMNRNGERIATIFQADPVDTADRTGGRSQGTVHLQPQIIAWNRSADLPEGVITVMLESQLQDLTGGTQADAAKRHYIIIKGKKILEN